MVFNFFICRPLNFKWRCEPLWKSLNMVCGSPVVPGLKTTAIRQIMVNVLTDQQLCLSYLAEVLILLVTSATPAFPLGFLKLFRVPPCPEVFVCFLRYANNVVVAPEIHNVIFWQNGIASFWMSKMQLLTTYIDMNTESNIYKNLSVTPLHL